jgi:hypothetical protein
MTRHRCATATGKELETVVEPGRNTFDPQGRGARGGKLDPQWDAVEAAANAGDRNHSASVRRKRRISRARPLDEQPNGAVA